MDLLSDDRWGGLLGDLGRVGPELWVVVTMCAVILVPFIKRSSVTLPLGVAMAGLGGALITALVSLGNADAFGHAFAGSLTIDPFSQFFKVLLLVFTLAVILQWLMGSAKQTGPYDVPDFLCLLLGASLGMSLMASASSLLTIFVATESASIPSFALAGFRKRHRVGSEGSLKYVVFGAASSALMLYGMSLVYGTTGTLSLIDLRDALAADAAAGGIAPLTALGLLAMFAGFAFKLSAVPLHFWCPDVFQGAPIEVTTFLSVVSKGAALCMLLRVLSAFSTGGVTTEPVLIGVGVGIAILGAVTATWGNLVALHQNNIRRLLAYSSIAHAGYMIMAASVMVVADSGTGDTASRAASGDVAGAVLFYLLVYLFMNLGAFTIASLIEQSRRTEDIRDYAGMMRTQPLLAIPLALFLLSLFGMPGLGGFIGKIYLMAAMADAGTAWFALVAVLLINTLLSLYYYMKPIYYMTFVTGADDRPPVPIPIAGGAIVGVSVFMLLLTGLFPSAVGDSAIEHGVIYRRPLAVAGSSVVHSEPTPADPDDAAVRVTTLAERTAD